MNEVIRMRKAAVVASFKLLTRNLPGESKENREKNQDIRSPGGESNHGPTT
jgi:hypothetical protein